MSTRSTDSNKATPKTDQPGSGNKKRTTGSSAKKKETVAIKIGQRIKQARKMAGFKAAKDLNVGLMKHGWSASRLGNYEAGVSLPGPEEIRLIAELTDTSECWIYFGVGPIRSRARDIQAVRYQNLTAVINQLDSNPAAYETFLSRARATETSLSRYLTNPMKKIGERQAHTFEKALDKPTGWFDEQHVENDPLCNRFPEELRELMMLYSEQDEKGRKLLLEMAKTISRQL